MPFELISTSKHKIGNNKSL